MANQMNAPFIQYLQSLSLYILFSRLFIYHHTAIDPFGGGGCEGLR